MFKTLAVLTTLFLPLIAGAVTIDFKGTVVGTATGDWAGESGIVEGSYSYDTDLMLSVSGSTFEKYQSQQLDGDNAPFESSWDLTITLGNETQSFGGWNQLFLTNSASDQYTFSAAGNAARIALIDSTGTAIDSLTGSIPTGAPDLGDWAYARGFAPGLQFIITELETVGDPAPGGSGAAVPEPSGALLFCVGLLVTGRAARNRSA